MDAAQTDEAMIASRSGIRLPVGLFWLSSAWVVFAYFAPGPAESRGWPQSAAGVTLNYGVPRCAAFAGPVWGA